MSTRSVTRRRQRTPKAFWSIVIATLQRIRSGWFEPVTHLSITYPALIRGDRIARVMTQFHYLLRTGSASAVSRTEDSVMFEAPGHFHMSARDILSSVSRGRIVARSQNVSNDFELSAELELSWPSLAVPGVWAIMYFWVARYHLASPTPLKLYLPCLVGPPIFTFVIRREVARTWRKWLENGVDQTFDAAREHRTARRARR